MIYELVGLIGAGKSTWLAKLRESQPDLCAVDLEDEETLHTFVLPLLDRVYKSKSGEDPDNEYNLEAFFALLRALSTKAAALKMGWTPPCDREKKQVVYYAAENSRSVMGSVLAAYPQRAPLLYTLSILVERLQLSAFLQPVDFDRLVAYVERAASSGGDTKKYTFIDRGMIDVLTFTLERIESAPHSSAIKKLVNLFFTMTGFLILETYHIPAGTSFCEAIWNLHKMAEKTPYQVLYKYCSVEDAELRIVDRNRPAEVADGSVKSRVKDVNKNLYKMYGDCLPFMPCVIPFATQQHIFLTYGPDAVCKPNGMRPNEFQPKTAHPLSSVIKRLIIKLCSALQTPSLEAILAHFGITRNSIMNFGGEHLFYEPVCAILYYDLSGINQLLEAIYRFYRGTWLPDEFQSSPLPVSPEALRALPLLRMVMPNENSLTDNQLMICALFTGKFSNKVGAIGIGC